MRIESSIITSLSELRAIEQQRIADERQALERARAAEIEATRAAEQARVAAEQARVRAERAELMRIEQARLEAEHEARMRVEAAEASERARLTAALDEQRLAEEMELRRAEVAKKRPTWMVVVTGLALLATIGFGWFAMERARESEQARQQQAAADHARDAAKEQARQAQVELDRLTDRLDTLDAQVALAERTLVGAQTRAEREAAAAAIAAARQQRAEIRRQQLEAERRRLEAERKGGYHIDESCLHDSIGCIDGKPKRRK
jgi:hypothetical protein